MNLFEANSFQLKDGRWAPAGMLFVIGGDTMNIQESELSPEFRFNTKKKADSFFREYYEQKGYREKQDGDVVCSKIQ